MKLRLANLLIFTLFLTVLSVSECAFGKDAPLTGVSCNVDTDDALNAKKKFPVYCMVENYDGVPIAVEKIQMNGCVLRKAKNSESEVRAGGYLGFKFDCTASSEGKFSADIKTTFNKKTPDGKLISFTTNTTFKENIVRNPCEKVDLDSKGGTLEAVKPSVQKMGSCQTHASLLLYDAWRFSHGATDQRLSSPGQTYLEQCHEGEITAAGNWGSYPRPVLEYLKTHPPCATSGQWGYGGLAIDRYEGFASDFTNAKDIAKVPALQLRDSVLACAKKYDAPLDTMVRAGFTQTLAQMKNFAELHLFLKLNCLEENKLKSAPYEVYSSDVDYGSFEKNKMNRQQELHLAEIHRCFEKNREKCQPFVISFCAVPFLYETSGDPKDPCGAHAAVIAGSRYNREKNRCEFHLIDSNDNGQKATKKLDAKSFDVWVDEKVLMQKDLGILQLREPVKK